MHTDSNVIDFTLFRRPNSLAKLPACVRRPAPPDDRWLRNLAAGFITAIAFVKLVNWCRR